MDDERLKGNGGGNYWRYGLNEKNDRWAFAVSIKNHINQNAMEI